MNIAEMLHFHHKKQIAFKHNIKQHKTTPKKCKTMVKSLMSLYFFNSKS